MNLVFGFGVHDHHNFASQQTQGHPALFAVVLTVVLKGELR